MNNNSGSVHWISGYLTIAFLLGGFLTPSNTSAQFVRNNIEYNMQTASLDEDSTLLFSPYFEVQKFNFFNAGLLFEISPGHYYPDTSNYSPPGPYLMLPDMTYPGDFNNDGLEDLAMQWVVFPHTTMRENLIPVDILINDGKGGFKLFMDYTNDQSLRHMPYRMRVGNFNGDEYDDLVSASMGVITRLADGSYFDYWEPFPVVVSNGDGTYRDATREVEGQEDGEPISTFGFAHDLSLGDVNGDGYDDFYQGRHLLVSNGDGSFSNETDILPEEFAGDSRKFSWNMSTEIVDLNNDGFGDIIAMYADREYQEWLSDENRWDSGLTPSGNIWMSNGAAYENRTIVPIADGWYDSEKLDGEYNTRFNYTVAYDVNLDGWLDIVSGVTRIAPYYIGSHIQIFESQQGESFIDKTTEYVEFTDEMDELWGEGNMQVRDANNDGILDLIHTKSQEGIRIFLNDGDKLHMVRGKEFPVVQPWHVEGGYPDKQPLESNRENNYIFPVDIDGNGPLDYISFFNYGSNVFYTMIGKKPLKTQAPTSNMVLTEGQSPDTTLHGNYHRIGWEDQSLVDAVTVKWSTEADFSSQVDSVVITDTTYTFLSDLSTNQTYYWQLRGWNNMGSTEWTDTRQFTTGIITSNDVDEFPNSYALGANYPNPFNPITTITYSLPRAEYVRLDVFDVTGKHVQTLVDGVMRSGSHSVVFDGSQLSSGLYLYTLQTSEFRSTKRMTLVK